MSRTGEWREHLNTGASPTGAVSEAISPSGQSPSEKAGTGDKGRIMMHDPMTVNTATNTV